MSSSRATPKKLDDKARQKIAEAMKKSGVPGLSLSVIGNGQVLFSDVFGVKDVDKKESLKEETRMEACSLSKLVLAYLVLKIINSNKYPEFTLDTPLYKIFQYDRFDKKDKESIERSKKITARMILSHTSGLPNWSKNEDRKLKCHFEPGTCFEYSGEGFVYLQKVIEHLKGINDIEKIMQEEVFIPLGMKHSNFLRPKDADVATPHNELTQARARSGGIADYNVAGGLYTTTNDYAIFMLKLISEMNSETAFGKLLKESMQPQVFMEKNQTAVKMGLKKETLQSVGWGMGWGLQKTNNDYIALQWGDGGNSKAFAVLNLKESSGVVYFANGYSGLAILEEVIKNTINVPLDSTIDYLAQIEGCDQYNSKGWEKAQALYVKGNAEEEKGNLQSAKEFFEQSIAEKSNKKVECRLKWLSNILQPSEVKLSEKELKNYAGEYGNSWLSINLNKNALYAKEGNNEYKLIPMSSDTFVSEKDSTFIFKFVPDSEKHFNMQRHLYNQEMYLYPYSKPVQKEKESTTVVSKLLNIDPVVSKKKVGVSANIKEKQAEVLVSTVSQNEINSPSNKK